MRLVRCVLVAALLLAPAAASAAAPTDSTRRELTERLSAIFGEKYIARLMNDPRLVLDPSIARRSSSQYHPRPSLFLPESVERGRAFLREHEQALARAEATTGVPSEIIAAILRVETDFGRVLGTKPVLVTLWSIYALDKRRREFAFMELVAFLVIAEQERWDPFAIIGSAASAMGIPQFLASSWLLFAKDGDGDGRINFFTIPDGMPDAAMSVGNYLARHGWGKTPESRHAAVYAYNHSDAYVESVLQYAEKIRR